MRYLVCSVQTRATGASGNASGRERSRAPLVSGRRGDLGGVLLQKLFDISYYSRYKFLACFDTGPGDMGCNEESVFILNMQ